MAKSNCVRSFLVAALLLCAFGAAAQWTPTVLRDYGPGPVAPDRAGLQSFRSGSQLIVGGTLGSSVDLETKSFGVRGPGPLSSLARVASQGALLADVLSGSVALLDPADFRQLGGIPQPLPTSIAVSAAGNLAYLGMLNGTIRVNSARSGILFTILRLHADPILDLATSPSGDLLAAACEDWSVSVWSATTGRLGYQLFGHVGRATSVSFSRDGRLLATAGVDGTIRWYRVEDGDPRGSLAVGTPGPSYSVAFTASPDVVAVAPVGGPVSLWNLATGTRIAQLLVPSSVTGLAIADSGRSVAVQTSDGAVSVFDAATGALKSRVGGPPQLRGFEASLDGRIGVGGDPQIQLVRLDGAFETLGSYNLGAGPRKALSSTGRVVALGTLNRAGFAIAPDYRLREVVPFGAVNDVAVTPDGSRVIFAGSGWLDVYVTDTGVLERRLDTVVVTALTVDPVGRKVFFAEINERVIKSLDLTDGAIEEVVPLLEGGIERIATSRQGALVAASTRASTFLVNNVLGIRTRIPGAFPVWVSEGQIPGEGAFIVQSATGLVYYAARDFRVLGSLDLPSGGGFTGLSSGEFAAKETGFVAYTSNLDGTPARVVELIDPRSQASLSDLLAVASTVASGGIGDLRTQDARALELRPDGSDRAFGLTVRAATDVLNPDRLEFVARTSVRGLGEAKVLIDAFDFWTQQWTPVSLSSTFTGPSYSVVSGRIDDPQAVRYFDSIDRRALLRLRLETVGPIRARDLRVAVDQFALFVRDRVQLSRPGDARRP